MKYSQALTVSLLGVCEREGCGRPRARNPRTGKVHPFCSLRCNRFEGSGQPIAAVTTTDFAMDLVIALEMSRLQLIEDQMQKQCRSGDQAGSSSSEGRERQAVDEFSEDAQLRLAIHLSLEESRLKPQDVNCAKTQLKNLTSNSVTSTQDLKSSKTLFGNDPFTLSISFVSLFYLPLKWRMKVNCDYFTRYDVTN